MSRILLSLLSYTRVTRSCTQMRLKSSSGPKCPPEPPGNTCEPAIGVPASPPVCSTDTGLTGRTDAEFDKCLADHIANPMPVCTRPNFATFPCEKQAMPANRGKTTPFEGESAWTKVDCCNFSKCVLTPIRHDVLYLEPSKKCWRRTWYDWSALCMEEQDKCRPEKLDVEPPEYRARVGYQRPGPPPCPKWNPCEPEPPRPSGQINKAATADQPKVKLDPCPKIRLPGCKRTAEKIKCSPPVAPGCCKKRCTQYPSFSECCRKDPPAGKGSECDCLRNLSKCEGFNRLRWLMTEA